MWKQMSILSLIMVGVVLMGSSGCLMAKKPATFDTIFQLKVEEVSENPKMLRVSGGSMDSSRRVGKISKIKEGNSMIIIVYLTLLKGTGTGHFSELVEIDDSIKFLKFGPEKIVIWERKVI